MAKAGELRRRGEGAGPGDTADDEGEADNDEDMEDDGTDVPERCVEECAAAANGLDAGELVLGDDPIKPDLEQAAPPSSSGMPYSQPEGSGPAEDAEAMNSSEQPFQAETLSVRVILPSGTTLPLRASKATLVSDIKEALRQQCGWPPGACMTFGLAWGRAALREDATLGSNDVASGDAIVVFQRTGQ